MSRNTFTHYGAKNKLEQFVMMTDSDNQLISDPLVIAELDCLPTVTHLFWGENGGGWYSTVKQTEDWADLTVI